MNELPDLASHLEAGAAVLAGQPDDPGIPQHHSEGKLRFQKCKRCGYLRYPMARICPQCLESEATWTADAGDGAVWSYCVYHKAFHPAFAKLLPYVVALVELDSGPRIITNIVGVPLGSIHIGLRGVAAPRLLPDGTSLAYFFPTSTTTEGRHDR